MANPACVPLFFQILINAVLLIQVGVNVHLAHIVEQIEIKVLSSLLFPDTPQSAKKADCKLLLIFLKEKDFLSNNSDA